MADAVTSETPAVTEQLRIVPAIPGYLLIGEIAQVAGVKPATIRGYRLSKAAGFPPEDSRAGTTPLWLVSTIANWLSTRPLSQTQVEVRPDGSVVVITPSDFKSARAEAAAAASREKQTV